LLGSGSLSGPRAPHLELRSTGGAGARFVAGIAEREGLALQVIERSSHTIAYTKGGETIADLLAVAGAGQTALRLDEHAVMAATRAHANRLANADEANLVRITKAAQAQLQAIRLLEGTTGWSCCGNSRNWTLKRMRIGVRVDHLGVRSQLRRSHSNE
jgi:DNA-binding protein WhiA